MFLFATLKQSHLKNKKLTAMKDCNRTQSRIALLGGLECVEIGVMFGEN